MYLEKIAAPRDIKNIPLDQLPVLAQEIRQRILEVTSKTGGHIASSLGAVELIVALHYCLDAPRDKILFDVGHQAYAHKILTGRNKGFDTLRQYGGMSGFPSKEESEYDTCFCGHSSTSVSAALGIACARDAARLKDPFKVVAVIGDGSLSGGLCFEGLNNAGHLKKDLLVVLNTNELSIAPNVGAISTYLNKLISLPIYNRFRASFDKFLEARVPKGRRLKAVAAKLEEGLKGLFIPGILFEELGFRYFGPLDGHDLGKLVPTLRNILGVKGPRLVHIITKKGKGYAPAEKDPVRFHSTGPFDIASGEPASRGTAGRRTYTDVFGEAVVRIAARDPRVVAVTAAMPEGTGLDKFRDAYPQRFFDVGIAEQHAACFAGGLALAGLRPVVAIYSTFFQRALDQVFSDVALQKAAVVFCLDRAGIVGEDGVTHQGVFDIPMLRGVPDLVMMAPQDGAELEAMLEFAISLDKPCVIRYPKSVIPALETGRSPLALGRPDVLRMGKDYCLIALGSMVEHALAAQSLLAKEGLSGMCINARFIKPLDPGAFAKAMQQIDPRAPIITVEDGVIDAGFGSAVSEALGRSVERIGLPDQFIVHGKRQLLLEKYGLDPAGIALRIKNAVKKNGKS
ncbi:MAG: 1-deoxy-D-xylulose-5-phosphate synthase [Candidatus Omnitrophica bacterium]|nr:1-deoxy-D-xylulose-5-phosphate synthase [Candidatus Omnitrophota bacterium]MDD5774325.1 1-deoxy-D-xylulose-5-phosphate synthase [Candidatus Omnitrophota bacterium]